MPRLLYVEDNDDNVFMLRRRLERRGYEVLVATDGETGLASAAAEQPDLILMDLGLPGIDGWETTRRLRADPVTAKIPVIALSAHAMAADRDSALDAGCDDFDTKPVDLDRLLAKIDACLDLARRRETEHAAASVDRASEPTDAPNAEGPTLLVVDDSDDNRYTLVRRLRRQGHEHVLEAADGPSALELLRTRPIDLVLLDVMMPGMSGADVLAAMKQDMDLRELPVIMISALDDHEVVVRCLELGAEDYLPKPFDPTVLNARVTASLEKRRLRKQQADYLDQVERERERADRLLTAMVPTGAVSELKARDTVAPRRFEEVAVMFCDIVGFTSFCDRTSPEEVVSGLDAQVVAFERISERHRMEKIKTIGDAYMATAGLLLDVEHPLATAVDAGLEMVQAARSIEPYWEVRVGIHVGPVVAGMTGRHRFQFDLWGDTVNVAARICDRATPSSVVVAASAWPTIRGRYRGRSLGSVELKGKGPLELVECLPLGAAVPGE
jgi:adenylate cyclase